MSLLNNCFGYLLSIYFSELKLYGLSKLKKKYPSIATNNNTCVGSRMRYLIPGRIVGHFTKF